MKTLAFLAVLLLSAAVRADAYSHSITNQQGRMVKVWVNYVGCGNDTWFLKPGEVVTFRSGWCCISKVRFFSVDDDMKSNPGPTTTSPNGVGYCENTNIYLSRSYGNQPYVFIK